MTDLWPVVRSLTFEQPLAWWLLALAAPLILIAPRVRLRHASLGLKAVIVTLRLVIVTLLVVALAEPRIRPTGHARAIVFALDTSDSVSADQQQWARAWVERAIRLLPPGSHAETVEFASRAQRSPTDQPSSATSTDLSAALRLAGALLPSDPSATPEIVPKSAPASRTGK